MKRMMLFALILALAAVFTAGGFAEETQESLKSGDWSYVVQEDGTAKVTYYRGKEASVTVPLELDGIPVTAVGTGTFRSAKKLTGAVVPEGITVLEEDAFGACRTLESVSLPSTLKAIGSYAFSGCVSLKEITIPDGVSDFAANPFDGCEALEAIHISPDQAALTEKDGVFFSRDGSRLLCYPLYLTEDSYTIPDGVVIIGDSAFVECTALQEIVIPESVTTIEHSAFYGCTGIEALRLPDSITEIGEMAFGGMGLLAGYLPAGVTKISDSLFDGCDSMETVYIHAGVTEAGQNPFAGCVSLQQIDVAEGNTALEAKDGVLFSKADHRLVSYSAFNPAESYTVPEGTEIIGDFAFDENEYLREVTFPEGLKEIGYAAFADCLGLTKVILPDSIQKVGTYAFAFIPCLEEVSVPASLTDIDEKAFARSGEGEIITVR